jgi:hypothetical protein
MRYSENIDYIVSAAIYLGTQEYWWARTSKNMARELGLDVHRLEAVLSGFPGIFRRSHQLSPEGMPYFALQARYAQYEAKKGEEPETVSYIAPVSVEKLRLLLDFVLKMAEHEKESTRSWATNGIAAVAAVLSAATAIWVAVLK